MCCHPDTSIVTIKCIIAATELILLNDNINCFKHSFSNNVSLASPLTVVKNWSSLEINPLVLWYNVYIKISVQFFFYQKQNHFLWLSAYTYFRYLYAWHISIVKYEWLLHYQSQFLNKVVRLQINVLHPDSPSEDLYLSCHEISFF